MNAAMARWSRLHQVTALLGRPLAVLDIEASTAFGNPGFGLTDWCVVTLAADGTYQVIESLVAPGYPIDADMTALNGLTAEDVATASTWPQAGADHMFHLSESAIVCGYNSSRYDCPAIQAQAKRYRLPVPQFPNQIDVYTLFRRLTGKQMPLAHAAAEFGLSPEGDLHRARTDALLCADLLDRLLLWYGLDSVLTAPLARKIRKD
ncbi:MAG: hypothetical protein CVV05_01120 [Gammaproteobacteria bacterium HGW-Gammaproteobacteria-1]|jgi:DNA polymerase III epsilon subunit-like protein|nr:MAG: hypothetical protein CVV05_01120 [Gammaproteobacteria bacterium HGW-Gammaproteobacteria-1]